MLAQTVCMRPRAASTGIFIGVSSLLSTENTYCLVIYNEQEALLERMTKFQLAAKLLLLHSDGCYFSFSQINAFFHYHSKLHSQSCVEILEQQNEW